MTVQRLDEITLFCEDRAKGRSQRLIEVTLQELRTELPFALEVAPIGISSKDDVQVRAKFARADGYRACGLRDRDFLQRSIVEDYRLHAFHKKPENVRPWPLTRYCIESYLMDDDVLTVAVPGVDAAALRAIVDGAAAARRWLDVARGTFDDLAWRLRRADRGAILARQDWPCDKESALCAVREAVEPVRTHFHEANGAEQLEKKLDALAADMEADGPLRERVDGRSLIADVERSLSSSFGASVPAGGLLSALDDAARKRPPAALLAELRALLEKMPGAWRVTER